GLRPPVTPPWRRCQGGQFLSSGRIRPGLKPGAGKEQASCGGSNATSETYEAPEGGLLFTSPTLQGGAPKKGTRRVVAEARVGKSNCVGCPRFHSKLTVRRPDSPASPILR